MKPMTPPDPTPRRTFLRASASLLSAAALGPIARAAAPGESAVLPRSIHPYPNRIAWGTGTLALAGRAALALGPGIPADVTRCMEETWRRFTFGALELQTRQEPGLAPLSFTLAPAGKPAPQPRSLQPGATHSLAVTPDGICALASEPAAVRHAWFTLLQLLDPDDAPGDAISLSIPHAEIQDWPATRFRGIHLCIFRETPRHMIERAIRLAGFLKFTHVTLEFWGMLRLDALEELSWPDAWPKEDARRMVAVAREMGLEIIPMFNCWGHASSSRIRHGRHVVLDQNPKLATLFEPDGWTWCLTNPRAQDLLRRVIDELIDVAGPGAYFHIGCDEAYSHGTCDRCRAADRVGLFADHVNGLARHLRARGRRAIMWGDALLERSKWPAGFAANGSPSLPTHLAIDRVDRAILIADWHYDVTKGDVPTLAHFKQHGFDTLACPWNSPANIRTLAKAANAIGNAGVLMTTWHHLVQSIPALPYAAACVWSVNQGALGLRQTEGSLSRAAIASLLRKLVPAEGRFERAGWNTFELPAETD